MPTHDERPEVLCHYGSISYRGQIEEGFSRALSMIIELFNAFVMNTGKSSPYLRRIIGIPRGVNGDKHQYGQ